MGKIKFILALFVIMTSSMLLVSCANGGNQADKTKKKDKRSDNMMSQKLTEAFHFIDWSEIEKLNSAEEKYKQIVQWALNARQSNPDAFDNLIGWILDDSEWTKDQLAKNEEILMNGVILRFREQNTKMRTYLRELESSGVVNTPVFNALDQFDKALSGSIEHEVHDIAQKVLNDFSLMTDRSIREIIAGKNIDGDDSFKNLGWLNFLSGSDSQVQWCLFMPDYVAQQQKGFKVESFEYKTLPAMRFIGKDDATPLQFYHYNKSKDDDL